MDFLLSLIALLLLLGMLAGVGYGIYRLVLHSKSGTPQTVGGNASVSVGNSLAIRGMIVGIIGLVMLIPLNLVDSIVDERHSLYNSVLYDIASSWGQRQDLRGPMLVVPYVEKFIDTRTVKDDDGKEQTIHKTRYVQRTAVALPEILNIDAKLDEQYRQRGIYESLVYSADLTIDGHFLRPDIESLSSHIDRIEWDKAFVAVGLSDTRAIGKVDPLQWNGSSQDWSPGSNIESLLNTGFHAPLKLAASTQQHSFKITINANGSDGFYFAPFGSITNATLHSNWPHPSFQGAILPASSEISASGFTAEWSIPKLARNYPQLWTLEERAYQNSDKHQEYYAEVNPSAEFFTTGVRLFEPVFLYSLIERAVKYGVLFIALTFMTFLIFELVMGARLHYVQYGLIGTALALFFLTLLSLAEHIAFTTAYASAAGIAIGMITLYCVAALRSVRRTVLIAALLSGLYGLLYSILHLEDYALLMGTGLVLVVVVVLMFVTRNIGKQEAQPM